MSEVQTLQDQAARAERLASAATNQDIVDNLRALAREYQIEAARLRASDCNCPPRMAEETAGDRLARSL
jgi:hypothetical protein